MKNIVPGKNYNQLFDEALDLWTKRDAQRSDDETMAATVTQIFPESDFFNLASRAEAENWLLEHTGKHLAELIEYAKAYDEAMTLWHRYAEESKTLLDQYEIKRQLAKTLKPPMSNLKTRTLERFPKVEFLSLGEADAKKYLRKRKSTGVRGVIAQVLRYKEDEVRNTIIAFIRTADYRANNRDKGYGVDPSVCSCGGKVKSHIYGDTLVLGSSSS